MLPKFLRSRFDEAELDSSLSSSIALDRAGMIVWANAAWRRRAQAYGVQPADGPVSYFDAIQPPLRAVFEQRIRSALESDRVVAIDYECPTPDAHQTFRLRVLPAGGAGVLLEHSLSIVRPAELGEAALTSSYAGASEVILHCGNCRRTRHPSSGSWHWVADWVRTPVRRSSHGICPTCERYFWGDG